MLVSAATSSIDYQDFPKSSGHDNCPLRQSKVRPALDYGPTKPRGNRVSWKLSRRIVTESNIRWGISKFGQLKKNKKGWNFPNSASEGPSLS
ncbi:hypothetical protein J6590_049655 [Homalodisca vitripennis]|nr:hypothetical protein J6590_049655 [Homalodisca vitripennis]